MNYSMTFSNNQGKMMSISDITFLGKQLDIPEIKRRFNEDFVKGTADIVQIDFVGDNINKSFIAGFRGQKIVICDMKTKEEMSIKEFGNNLNELNAIMSSNTTHCLL